MNGPDWLIENSDLNKAPEPEKTPTTSAGDEFYFQGGTISSVFNGGYLDEDYDGNTDTVLDNPKKPAPMFALFDFFRYRDGDGNDDIWTATVPVYKDSAGSCTNPSGAVEIIGFANIEINLPNGPPDHTISITVDCDFAVIDGRGSGQTYGNAIGTIPNLVK